MDAPEPTAHQNPADYGRVRAPYKGDADPAQTSAPPLEPFADPVIREE